MSDDQLNARLSSMEQMLAKVLRAQAKVVDVDGAADILCRSRQAVYSLVHARRIQASKKEGKLYFDVAYLNKWMMSNTELTIEELADRSRIKAA